MKVKVLFVCLGNICRSPLAEGLFRKKVESRGWSDYFHIDSSGTGDYHIGELPDPRMRATARDNGLMLESRARQLIAEDLERFDYIIPMDDSNRSHIHSMDPEGNFREKIILMRYFDKNEFEADVPDPYFGDEDGFQRVYDMLDDVTENFLNWLAENHDFNGNITAR